MKVNKMVTAGSEIQNGTEEESILLRQTASQRGGKNPKASLVLMARGFYTHCVYLLLFSSATLAMAC